MKTRVRWNRHTLAFLAIVIGMWYAAEAQSNGAAHLIALLAAAMGGLSWLHARANLRGLSVRLLGARTASQDASATIPVELRATGAVSASGLEVLVEGADAVTHVERVPAGGVVHLNLPPPQRSGGSVKVLVRSVFPLGLFTAETALNTSWVRRLHPRASGNLLLPKAEHQGGTHGANDSRNPKPSGSGDDFAGLREWRLGDSPRHIDWRALARGGPLMVKAWGGGSQGVAVLDWDSLTLPVAQRAPQLVRWMELCEAEGQAYELKLPGQTLRAGLGAAHQRRCLDALAMFTQEAGDSTSIAEPSQEGKADAPQTFENSSHLPRRPMLFLCAAMLLSLWPMQGYVASAGLFTCALCLIWRGVLFQPVPHLAVRLAVIMAGGAAVYADYGELRGMEPGIALLLVLAGAKALESRSPREFQILALIGWFLAFCIILLESHLSRSAWMAGVFLLITGCMVRFRRSQPGLGAPARITATLLIQALPLVALLFFVFPRGLLDLNAALGRSRFGQTGIDSTLDPGSVSRIAQTSEVAFRVRFPEGMPPPYASRYWRCLTLWNCEGLRWTRGERLGYVPRLTVKREPEDVRQIIDLEAHGKNWLPALDTPLGGVIRGQRLYPEFDQTLSSPVQIRTTERLEIWSRSPKADPHELAEHHREAALQLPAKLSPRLRQLTDSWEAAAQTDEQIVQFGLNYIATQGFTYALESGEYPGPDGLEDFVFNRKLGFCEHFSASFATLMRMSGVPARVVVGYLGGEYSELNGGYLIIKQSDVHAWTEVWLERYGWYRVDPTGALAPDRVNVDLRTLLAGGAAAAERERSSLWYRAERSLRLMWDSMSYAWQDKVIDFDKETQRGIFETMGLRQSGLMQMLVSMLFIGLTGAGVAWWLRRPARHVDPWARSWQRVGRRIVRAGVSPPLASEGPLDFAQRAGAVRPDLADQLNSLADMYSVGRYGAGGGSLKDFTSAVARFRPSARRK